MTSQTTDSDKPTCDKATCLKRMADVLADNKRLKRQVEVLEGGLRVQGGNAQWWGNR